MEFDLTKTIAALAVLYVVVAAALFASPMPIQAILMSIALFVVFGAAVLYLGVRYGEYRATQA